MSKPALRDVCMHMQRGSRTELKYEVSSKRDIGVFSGFKTFTEPLDSPCKRRTSTFIVKIIKTYSKSLATMPC